MYSWPKRDTLPLFHSSYKQLCLRNMLRSYCCSSSLQHNVVMLITLLSAKINKNGACRNRISIRLPFHLLCYQCFTSVCIKAGVGKSVETSRSKLNLCQHPTEKFHLLPPVYQQRASREMCWQLVCASETDNSVKMTQS